MGDAINSLDTPNKPSALSASDVLSLASHQTRWAPEMGDYHSEVLSHHAANPQWRNEDLLTYTLRRANRCSAEGRATWMAYLLENCIWHTHTLPHRLHLCKEIIQTGLADFHYEPAWDGFGGLLHIAAEAGSLEALQWAYEQAPADLFRSGGSFRLTPLHCAALRDDEESSVIIEKLLAWGVDPHALTRDGRSALFRARIPQNAALLMKAGVNPLQDDYEGFSALGFWLEMGLWPLAKLYYQEHLDASNALRMPLKYGSLHLHRYYTQSDLPASIYAQNIHTREHDGYVDHLLDMLHLGARFDVPGAGGKSTLDHIKDASVRALLEREDLLMSSVPLTRQSEIKRL